MTRPYGLAGRSSARPRSGNEELRAAGHSEAFLFIQELNFRALSVYAGAGYVPDGTVRESDFDGRCLRELRLVKPL